MKAGGRNYAPGKTTTDEREAVMEAGGRNYAPAQTTTDDGTRRFILSLIHPRRRKPWTHSIAVRFFRLRF